MALDDHVHELSIEVILHHIPFGSVLDVHRYDLSFFSSEKLNGLGHSVPFIGS